MKLREALNLCYVDWPRNKKLKCPYHPEKDGSLHLYEKTNSWTCFSCGATGDGYGLLSALTGQPIGDVLKRHTGGQKATVRPAKTYLLRERLERLGPVVTQPLFRAIRNNPNLETWQQELLLFRASDWWDEKKEELAQLPPFELNKAILEAKAEALRLREEWKVDE